MFTCVCLILSLLSAHHQQYGNNGQLKSEEEEEEEEDPHKTRKWGNLDRTDSSLPKKKTDCDAHVLYPPPYGQDSSVVSIPVPNGSVQTLLVAFFLEHIPLFPCGTINTQSEMQDTTGTKQNTK